MQRRDDRAVLDLLDELNLVEQEDHTRALGGRRRTYLQEELGEVTRDRAFIGLAQIDGQLDAVGSHHLDRAQVGKRLAHGSEGASAQLQPRQRRRRVPRNLGHKAAVRCQLVVVGQQPLGLCTIFEGVEQHGLADSSQPVDDHALLCRAPLEAADEDAKMLQLLIAAGQLRRARPGVGGVRVAGSGSIFRSYIELYAVLI